MLDLGFIFSTPAAARALQCAGARRRMPRVSSSQEQPRSSSS